MYVYMIIQYRKFLKKLFKTQINKTCNDWTLVIYNIWIKPAVKLVRELLRIFIILKTL